MATESDLPPTVRWILWNSASDINYRMAIPQLTDGELRYCLEHDRRKTGRAQLVREWRRRFPAGSDAPGLVDPEGGR